MKFESNPESGLIVMRGGIGDFEDCISADDFLEVLAEHTGDITIELDSPGGVVPEGLSIYNALSKYEGGEVTVHIDAQVGSIATVICCAADHVKMNSNATYMIHCAWTAAIGNCRDFRAIADLMEMMDAEIAKMYADKTGTDPSYILEKMQAETFYNAQQALEEGFVDEVVEVQSRSRRRKEEDPRPVASVGMSPQVKALIEDTARRLRWRMK